MFATLRSCCNAASRESVLADYNHIHISDLLSNVWNWKLYPNISEPELFHICGNSIKYWIKTIMRPSCNLTWYYLNVFYIVQWDVRLFTASSKDWKFICPIQPNKCHYYFTEIQIFFRKFDCDVFHFITVCSDQEFSSY